MNATQHVVDEADAHASSVRPHVLLACARMVGLHAFCVLDAMYAASCFRAASPAAIERSFMSRVIYKQA